MKPLYIALICAGALILLALFLWLSNNWIKISRYKLKTGKLKGRVRVVHLSDLHGKSFGKNNGRLLKKVARLTPDIIFITGDVIHLYRPKDIRVACNAVEGLSKLAPVYYVSGNHEMRSLKYRQLKEDLIKAGAHVLEDGCESVCGINICGVNCAHIKSGKYFNLGKEGCNILLTHLPQYITRYAAAGYDFVFCGHAHGGQWRLPFTKIGIYSPGQGLFPKYTGGVHSCGNMRQVISRGLGNSECPIRLFNRPEIVVADIEE